MSSTGVQATLTVLLLSIATVKADEGRVTFWRENFTMICPENGTWFKDNKVIHEGNTQITKTYVNGNIHQYNCGYEDRKYQFYVHGKACKNCFEMDAALFAVAITVDMSMTAVVMIIIYRCTKKKSSAGLFHTSKAPARSEGRARPVTSPEYEQLNIHTRSQDAYSVVNRMG